jgi:hypothetical protein
MVRFYVLNIKTLISKLSCLIGQSPENGFYPPFFGPASSASAKPEAVTMIAMFHAHLFRFNLVAAFKAAAGARACTTKTTTTKD